MKTTRTYPGVNVDTASAPAVGQAGGVLLTETVVSAGLGRELSAALSPWRKPMAIHDPAKILTDLALSLVVGGDTLSDVVLFRAGPGIYGQVAKALNIGRSAMKSVTPLIASHSMTSCPRARADASTALIVTDLPVPVGPMTRLWGRGGG